MKRHGKMDNCIDRPYFSFCLKLSAVLLENVFLKFGLADSDEQLQKCLAKFLCPVLLKLTSKQDGIQEKVCAAKRVPIYVP